MAKNWYLDVLDSKLKKLYSLGNLEDSETIKKVNDTITLLEILIYGDGYTEYLETGISDGVLLQRRRMEEYLPYFGTIEKLASREQLDVINRNYPVRKLSDLEVKEITGEFFGRALDNELYKKFRKIYKKWDKYVFMNRLAMDDFGEAFYLPYFDEVFIRVKKINPIVDLCSLGHEFGHGIQYLTNFSLKLLKEKGAFVEIVSTFFEFLMSDYLKSIGEFRDAACAQEMYFHDRRAKKCDEVIKLNELLNSWSTITGSEHVKMKKINGDIKATFLGVSDFKELARKDIICYAPYVLAYVMATEIFLVYSSNKIEGLKLLKRIMELDLDLPTEVYYQKLLDMGLGQERSVSEYEKILKMKCSVNF